VSPSLPYLHMSTTEPILQKVTIKAAIDGERRVGGLLAYTCREFGHVLCTQGGSGNERRVALRSMRPSGFSGSDRNKWDLTAGSHRRLTRIPSQLLRLSVSAPN